MRNEERNSAEAVLAEAPVFAHPEIEAAYHAGQYGSRLEADLADIANLATISAEPEAQPMKLCTAARERLNCLAIVQGEEILPVLDFSRIPRPRTLEERIRITNALARTLIDTVLAVVEDGNPDEDEDGGCHVSA